MSGGVYLGGGYLGEGWIPGDLPDEPFELVDLGVSFVWAADDANAIIPDVWQGFFYGFTRSVVSEPSGRRGTARIDLLDLFARLEQTWPEIRSQLRTTTGALIGLVHDYIGWTDPAFRSFDDGDPIPAGYTANTGDDDRKNGLAIIEELLIAERGTYWQDRDGVARYEDRDSRLQRALRFAVGEGMTAISPGVDDGRIVNRAQVTRTGGVPQEASDAESIRVHGPREGPTIESRWLISDSMARQIAEAIVAQGKDPRPPIRPLRLSGRTSKTLAQILGAEVGDLASVAESRAGTVGEYHVEQIDVQVPNRGAISASWTLEAKRPRGSAFVLGVSALGGPDVLGL